MTKTLTPLVYKDTPEIKKIAVCFTNSVYLLMLVKSFSN